MKDAVLKPLQFTKTLAFGMLLAATGVDAQTSETGASGKGDSAVLANAPDGVNPPTVSEVKAWEEILSDVTEITDTAILKRQLPVLERHYREQPNQTQAARLGILYHEVALNLGFLSQTAFKGYAQKSFDLLSQLAKEDSLPVGLRPFVFSYRASALALAAGETRKLRLVEQAFRLFGTAVNEYGAVCWAPLFLRGSVAENLPALFWRKKRLAAKDFSRMIALHESNPYWAPAKIKSFTYWAWAAQHPSKKYRRQAITYLHKAIALDPEGTAGREKAKALLEKWEYKKSRL